VKILSKKDIKTGILTLEYVDSDYIDLNIPVDPDFFPALDQCSRIHIGAIKNGHIAQAYQIPFMFLDDPYRGQDIAQMVQPHNPLNAFNLFVQRCVSGQPVHRDDLGNEDAMGCILGDAVPATLKFAPHLARRHQMEVKPGPRNVPGGGGPMLKK
jgi:hypothetical protein